MYPFSGGKGGQGGQRDSKGPHNLHQNIGREAVFTKLAELELKFEDYAKNTVEI